MLGKNVPNPPSTSKDFSHREWVSSCRLPNLISFCCRHDISMDCHTGFVVLQFLGISNSSSCLQPNPYWAYSFPSYYFSKAGRSQVPEFSASRESPLQPAMAKLERVRPPSVLCGPKKRGPNSMYTVTEIADMQAKEELNGKFVTMTLLLRLPAAVCLGLIYLRDRYNWR